MYVHTAGMEGFKGLTALNLMIIYYKHIKEGSLDPIKLQESAYFFIRPFVTNLIPHHLYMHQLVPGGSL